MNSTSEQALQLDGELSLVEPVWQGVWYKLYSKPGGSYIVRYQLPEGVWHYGVSPEGEIKDLRGYPIDQAAVHTVLGCFASAGQGEMYEKVSNWKP